MSDPKIEMVGGDPPPPKSEPPRNLWVLQIGYDPDVQGVAIEKDNKEFKSWDMILGVLAMATAQAEFYRNMGHAQNMQENAGRLMQEEMIRRQLASRKGRLHV